MSDRADKIFKKIEEGKIKPKSRWVFLARDYMVWVFFILTTLVGSLAMSVLIFFVIDNDWDVYKYLNKDFVSYLLLYLPYFWIFVLIVLAFLAYVNYKHTRRGYLVNPYLVIVASLATSAILGGIFFSNGMGEKIDMVFSQNISYYKNSNMQKRIIWNNPQKGLISGEVVKFMSDSSFMIMDMNMKEWEIIGESDLWGKNVNRQMGEKVKIIGEIKKNGVFKAKEVRPWGCGCIVCDKADINNQKNTK